MPLFPFRTRRIALSIVAASLLGATTSAMAQSRQDEQITAAAAIMDELRRIPEQAIPPALLDRAYAIAVIPDMLKIGIGIAGRHGAGVLSVRGDDGQWSAPVFIKLSGGSIGWQAGLQSSDLVLVFTNERGVRNITSGKFTLGADASIAAGPVGRHGSAATDGRFSAEVYSYSRARGLFAGVSVEGARLRIDDDANAAYYVEPAISAEQILNGEIRTMPDGAIAFTRRLPQIGMSAAAPAETTSPPAAESAPADPETEPAKTYAMGEQPAAIED